MLPEINCLQSAEGNETKVTELPRDTATEFWGGYLPTPRVDDLELLARLSMRWDGRFNMTKTPTAVGQEKDINPTIGSKARKKT